MKKFIIPGTRGSIQTTVLLLLFSLTCFLARPQIFDDFSDGDFTNNPTWFGDTTHFQITNSAAIPPDMKPALQLVSSDSDTSTLYLPNPLIDNTEWRFWIKLSFNTSANNHARVYLVSDQENLKESLNGYFVQIGGANDSVSLFRQTGLETQLIFKGDHAFTGNSTNAMRIKITRDNTGYWEMFSDPEGGYNFISEGSGTDNTFNSTGWFGIWCRYTTSNATKFYFDDFYVNIPEIDTIPPSILSVEVVSGNMLEVIFDEVVEKITAEDTGNYFVGNGLGNPVTATRSNDNCSQVTLEFSGSFEPDTEYLLTVSDVSDLSGNIQPGDSATFIYSVSQPAQPFSVLINEIMADVNPEPNNLPARDYLELYNPGDLPINLKDCTLQPRSASAPLKLPDIAIWPDSFLVIVLPADTALFSPYGQVIGLSGFSLNNEGTIVLRNQKGELIHSISYTIDWYKDSEKQAGGWSIEQIDPSKPCSGQKNWMASMHIDGGTPGRRNSTDGFTYSQPAVSKIFLPDQTTLKVTFNHVMDSLSLTNPTGYYIEELSLYPVTAVTGDLEFSFVILGFDYQFEEDHVYNLVITQDLPDCNGAIIPAGQTVPFVWPSLATPFEVVINEIMADPNPPVGLPDFEYVEIYNTTNRYISMQGWTFHVGMVEKPVPDLILQPGEHILFVPNSALWIFQMFGRSFGFSSLGLTNSGATLSLLNDKGVLISGVSYSDTWYGDTEKADGGWSLEQIDPFNPCAGEENWSVSMAEEGGTPGKINSIDAENLVIPAIQKIIPVDDKTVRIYFNQAMDHWSCLNPQAYYVDQTIGFPTSAVSVDSARRSVLLTFGKALLKRTVYTLSVEQQIFNCKGLELTPGTEFRFGLSEPAEKNDVVINEVLFNPSGDGVDFVEIYNRSDKIIDMVNLKLGNVSKNSFGVTDTAYKTITADNQLLLEGEYLVLTTNPNKVKEQYLTVNPSGFLGMASMPSYNNASGTVVLSGINKQLADVFEYEESMHHPLLNTVEGVSLERIHFDRPSSDRTNWHSASSSVGYATPGYKNSQFSEPVDAEAKVIVHPEVFSPDNDGVDDVLNISYRFDSPGLTASVHIFDSRGRLVKNLVSNELLGTEGTFSWDGCTEDNQKANIGIYIIFFEAFGVNGEVKKYKKTAVLAGKIGK
ncbi:MAG: lamin tail domain-containing protein [Bacteroidales bacterium]